MTDLVELRDLCKYWLSGDRPRTPSRIDDDILLELVECTMALGRIDKWLEREHKDGGTNLDHVSEEFMIEWKNADIHLANLEKTP